MSFKVGDQIEVVERSANAEDWWTGKLNGVKGVFPGELQFGALTFMGAHGVVGNYVQDIS